MVIDVHTHFVPEHLPKMVDRLGGDRWPVTQCVCGKANHKHLMISGKNFRTITDQCWSAQRRIEDMVAEGVDAQVISPMPELLSYWFDPKDTLEFSRYINEQLSQAIQINPKKFYGLGMLPLQDPDLAAKEIRNLKQNFGLLGVEVGTNVNGKSIGDPIFDPFFAEAEAQNLSIFIHPLHPVGNERIIGPPSLAAMVGFPVETAFALTSLITSGILERYPNLKIAASHGGGAFSTVLPRLNYGWETMEQIREVCPNPPIFYAKKLYFDTLVYEPKKIKYLLELFDASQMLIGSDYPFVIREKNPGHWKDELELTSDEWNQMAYQNCLSFLNLKD
jgi:aminocarboxymuconate-semialdehyde decarboxylase